MYTCVGAATPGKPINNHHIRYWFNGTILIPLTFANFIATLEATLQPAEYADTREYDEVLHRWQRHQDYR